jgi:hypothetical protein
MLIIQLLHKNSPPASILKRTQAGTRDVRDSHSQKILAVLCFIRLAAVYKLVYLAGIRSSSATEQEGAGVA